MNTSFKKLMCIITILVFTALIPAYSKAEKIDYTPDNLKTPVIIDKADLLSDYDEVSLKDSLSVLREKTGYRFFVFTVTETNDYVKGRELQTIYNDHFIELRGAGVVFLLISTSKDNPICELQTYNDSSSYFNKEINSYISNELKAYCSSSQYDTALLKFPEYIEKAVNGEIVTEESDISYSTYQEYLVKNSLLAFLTAAIVLFITIIFVSFVVIKISGNRKSARKMSSDINIAEKSLVKISTVTENVTYVRTHKTASDK